MPKWRPMDGEGGIGSPLLKTAIELASHVVVLDVHGYGPPIEISLRRLGEYSRTRYGDLVLLE
jgi:hypothetical protein